MKRSALFQVLAAIILGFAAGFLSGPDAGVFGISFYQIYGMIGHLFLNALNLVVIPLVSAAIITGAARMGSEQSFGEIGLKMFGYFILTNFLAILVGWLAVSLIAPGAIQQEAVPLGANLDALALQANGGAFDKIQELLLKIIPANIFAAAAKGEMIGLIGFCLVFGYFLSKIDGHHSSLVLGFWKGIFEIMMKITTLVMKALPIGVFGLIAKSAATMGWESIGSVGYYFLTVVVGLAVYVFVVLMGLLRGIAGVNPFTHLQAMFPALVTAFSTTSSAATLPVTLECLEKKSGVSNRICSLTIPLGTSMNLAGSTLQVVVSVFFIAQIYNFPLTWSMQFVVVAMALVTSVGMAGIPSASLITTVLILSSIGLPADGIALIMAVERILDMLRTPTNVFSNSCCAVLVARSEGEQTALVPSYSRVN